MKVFIADNFQEHGIAALKDAGCTVYAKAGLREPELVKAIRESECDILIVRSTKVTAAMLDASPNLALVVRAGSGVDTIDVRAATIRNIMVANCPGQNSVAVAELVMGLMIALDRRIVDETDDLRRGVWNKKEYSRARGLKGRTLGIVGLGRIGCEVAKRAHAFDMRIIYSDLVERKEVEKEFGVQKTSFARLLQDADFVSLHVPGGPESRHMIGRDELAMMKPTAFVINCSRGGVVDEKALAEAVQSGVIAGAALDVFEMEPAASDPEFKDPVAKVPHVYGTHHVGASTEQAQDAVADETVKIVRTWMATGRALNCVNTEEPVADLTALGL